MSHGGQQRLALLSRASIGALVALFVIVPVLIGQAASPPNIITYQGRLLDSNSSPVSSSTADMVFQLYDDPTAGNCVWSNSSATCASSAEITVTLTDGLFSENLGDTGASPAYAAIGDDIFADNASLYLQVTVEGEALSPRKQITAAPYALNSETLDGYNTSLTGGTSNFVPVTDSNGNLTLTGDPDSGDGSLYINPASASGSSEIFAVAENDSIYFRVLGNGRARFNNEVSIGTAPNGTTLLNIAGTYTTGGNSLSGVNLNQSISGDLNTVADEVVQGYDSTFTLSDGAGTDQINHIANFYGAFTHSGDGTTDNWRGVELSLSGTGGTLTQARGVEVSINSSATTNAYGGFFDVTNASGNNIALYTGQGAVYIDGRSTPLQSSPTNFTAGDGDLYVVGEVELDSDLYVEGNTVIGDDASDTIQLSGSLQGSTPLRFEGASVDGFDTLFAITDPTLSDKTITFQNATGTVAHLSDLTGSSITLDTAYDGGGSGAGRSISADSGAVTINNSTVGGATLFNTSHSASGTLTSNTTTSNQLSSSRTLTSASSITDDFETFRVDRSTTVNNAGATYASQGAVAVFQNSLTTTSGTLSDSTHVVEIYQDSSSTGSALRVSTGDVHFADNATIGSTSGETLSNGGFQLGGTELFVAGDAGIEGNIYTDTGLIIGATTTFTDGDIESSGTLTINNTNNQAITTGTGVLTVAGNLLANGNTTIGDDASDTLTINGTIQGASPLVFEGSSADDFETTFAITEPTTIDKTITFKNETGTVALLSDLTGSTVTLDTAYDGGGSGAGRTITADAGAIAIQNSTVGGAQLFDIAHSASGTLTANSDITFGVSSSRTLTGAQTITDDFETFNVTRTTAVNNAGADYSAQGAVAFFENIVTQTSGLLSDSTHVVEIAQDASSTGAALRVASGSTFLGDDLVVGGLALTETLSNTGFSLSGDDLFVVDDVGVEGNIYTDTGLIIGATTTFTDGDIESSGALTINDTNNQTITTGTGEFTTGGNAKVLGTALTLAGNSTIIDMTGTGTLGLNTTTNRDISTGTGGFDIGGHAAIGSGASVGTLEILNLSEDMACTSNCATIRAAVTNTTASFTDEVVGGNFNALSAVASAANGVLNGIKGSAQTTGSVTFSGDIIGTLGSVEVSSGNPTFTNAQGAVGKITLNDLTDITGAATGVASQLSLTTNQTLTGAGRLFTGSFAPSDGTIASVDGLNLSVGGTGGTITDLTGIYVSLDPSSGTTFSSSNTVQGINLEIDADNTSGTDASVYGINVAATTATDVGTPDAYGVRASASGGTNNYSGYFYGGPFIVAGDATAPAISTLEVSGAGDLHVENVLEVIGDMWVKGGNAAFETASGSTDVYIQSSLDTGYAGLTFKVDSSGAEWTVYGAGSSATTANGSATDFRWNAGTASDRGVDDEMRLTAAGELFLDTGVGVGAADLAEVYVVADASLTAGDIVSLNTSGDVVGATSTDDNQLFGVVSTAPGLTLNNGEDDTITSNERPIGLAGKVPTKVNLEGGTITAGDPITVSSVAGVGKKATGPGMIVGFALEDYTGTESPIEVFVNLQWNPGGKIAMDGSAVGIESDLIVNTLTDATPTDSAVDSESLILRGSAFDVAAVDRDISFKNIVTNATDYRLSIRNAVDSEIAYVDQDGAFSVAGDVIVGDHLYPSDRGTPQTNRYIFYDGSTGPGGDFMRTNAAGWATGSYDFAEMFPSSQNLEPGDVVTFASASESVERSTESYSGRIAGVVSTRPGFLAGENLPDNYPIALAGRVPTNVSNEGGEISVGDPLTTSSTTGVAMKATEAGMILGYALEDFSGSNGSIIAFINATYWNGQGAEAQPSNEASGLGASLGSLDLSGNVYIGANDILNVGSISGMNMEWEIAENGDFRTRGLVATTIEAYNGDLIDTYATTSPEVYVTLAGQVEMNDGRATVNLVKENPDFLATVSNMVPLRIVATPSAPIAVYVTNREDGKFDIMQLGGSSDGVMIDWYAVGVRKDFEKEEDLVIEEPGIPEEPEVEESDLTPEPPEEEEEEVVEEPAPAPVSEPESESTEESTEVVEEETTQEETEPIVEEETTEEPTPESEEEVVEEPAPEPVVEEEVIEEAPVAQEEPAPESEPIIEEEPAPPVEEEVPEEPASDVSSSPEPQQIPVESSNEDAGTASEGATE